MIAEVRQFEAMERVIPDNIPEEMRALQQWVLWRKEDRGGKPTKVPYQVNGRTASSTDPTHWVTFGEVLAALEDNSEASGIGFVFTQDDDFIGIDLDDCLDSERKPLPWAQSIIDALKTYVEVSPSGTGLKLFFRGEFPLDRGRKIKREDGGAIEVYTKGRYFTVTGNRFGDQCELANVESSTLASFADHYFTPVNKPELQPIQYREPTASNRPDIVSRAHKYALAYPPAISGQGGHDTTFRLACVLVNGFELDQATALTILQGWNLGCQPAWSAKELEHKIKSAASVGASGDRGYMLTEPEANSSHAIASDVDLSNFHGCREFDDSSLSIIKKPSETTPAIILEPPGFIGDVYRHILASSLYPLPEVSLMAATSLMSVLACRKVKTFKGATPNVYMMGIAESGSGKNHPRGVVRNILNAAGGSNLVGPETFKSGSAILESLDNQPAFIAQIDEIRDLFKAVSGKQASPWLQEISTVLLTSWGSGLASPWKASARADSRYNREIYCPQMVVFGTSTALIWQSITTEMKDGGLLGRFCVLQSHGSSEMQCDPFDESHDEVPTSIIEFARKWVDYRPSGNLSSQHPAPFSVPLTDDAKDAFRQHWASIKKESEGADEATRGILTRSQEITTRLALVAACACHDPTDGCDGLEIDACHVRWAEALVSWSNQTKLYEVSRNLAENSHHSNVLKAKRILQEAGATGLTQNQFTRKTQWANSQLRADILRTLLESGEIEAKEESTGKRPKTILRAI